MIKPFSLAVIGAGPKALALACKAKALYEMGYPRCNIHIFERNEVASHWVGQYGLTNGRLALGTAPEKDIGFPYQSQLADAQSTQQLNQSMYAYSYTQYLLEHDFYADWVDRGKPSPRHIQFAQYLKWVADKVSDFVQFHFQEVKQVSLDLKRWYISAQHRHGPFDGVLFSGPGDVKKPFPCPIHKDICDAYSYWQQVKHFDFTSMSRVAVIGAGESAASIVQHMLSIAPYDMQIDLIHPMGAIHQRGESYSENRLYSNPQRYHWSNLSDAQKVEFISRTDRGVISPAVVSLMNTHENIHSVNGQVSQIIPTQNKLNLRYSNPKLTNHQEYDKVILALGFDADQFLSKLISHDTQAELMKALDIDKFSSDTLSQFIDDDLSLKFAPAKIYLPMLAGLKQGPGFANLSCLGLMSDRILNINQHSMHKGQLCSAAALNK